jgi:thymidylate synthase (FAD)
MQVKLVSITQPLIEGLTSAEDLISYCARVSNPTNQMNLLTAPKLLKYLIDHKHWSPFEMVSVTVEIQTSRAIAAQILRHRSFSFQEFSQRYSVAQGFEDLELRKQAEKNRQSSAENADLNEDDLNRVKNHLVQSAQLYEDLLSKGVARESARMVLPLNTSTTLYMSGTLRSWIHYIELRTLEDTQKEHRLIAEYIKYIFTQTFPNICEALNWTVTNDQFVVI